MNSSASKTWIKTQINPAIGARALWQAVQLPNYVWLGMVILAMAALSVTTLVRGREAARTAQVSYAARQQQLQAAESVNAQLRQEVGALKQNPNAIEREARRRLNYVAANEIVIVTR